MMTKVLPENKKNFTLVKPPSWFGFRFGDWISNKLTKLLEAGTPPHIRLIEMATVYRERQRAGGSYAEGNSDTIVLCP